MAQHIVITWNVNSSTGEIYLSAQDIALWLEESAQDEGTTIQTCADALRRIAAELGRVASAQGRGGDVPNELGDPL